MIKAEGLTKIFQSGEQKIVAIDALNFTVPAGQFLTISGKSGSGKSTLLYQLGLLDMPTSGDVFIDGVEAINIPESTRTMMRLHDLGYIFQDYAILPSLTALENTLLPLLAQGFEEKVAKEKSIRALEKVGLGDRLHNLPSQLSGGQQQRVSIARAIAHDPKIIFADEPTANLDTETSKQILEVFMNLNKDGQTIVMVTHELEYAKKADRTIIMADGKIISDVMNT